MTPHHDDQSADSLLWPRNELRVMMSWHKLVCLPLVVKFVNNKHQHRANIKATQTHRHTDRQLRHAGC